MDSQPLSLSLPGGSLEIRYRAGRYTVWRHTCLVKTQAYFIQTITSDPRAHPLGQDRPSLLCCGGNWPRASKGGTNTFSIKKVSKFSWNAAAGSVPKNQYFLNWVPPLQSPHKSAPGQERLRCAALSPCCSRQGPRTTAQVPRVYWLYSTRATLGTTGPRGAQVLVFSSSADGFKVPLRSRTPADSRHAAAVRSWPRHHTTGAAKTLEAKNWHLCSLWAAAVHPAEAISTQGLAAPCGQGAQQGPGDAALSLGWACSLPPQTTAQQGKSRAVSFSKNV